MTLSPAHNNKTALGNSQSEWIHFLRWVSAFLVCITHARPPFLADAQGLGQISLPLKAFYAAHGFGGEAVIVFFCLSGFLVGGEVIRDFQADVFSWRRYLIRRIARIYPVLLLAICITTLLDWTGAHYLNSSGLYTAGVTGPMLSTDYSTRLTPQIAIGNLLFLQEILVPTYGSNGPLWSLSYEGWYYLLFPLAVSLGFSKVSWWRRAILMVLVAGLCWFVGRSILLYFSVWLMGLLPVIAVGRMPRQVWWPALGASTMLLLSRLNVLDSIPRYFVDMALAFFGSVFIGALRNVPLAVPGRMRVHVFLASFSYSLYLTHWPVALFVAAFVNQFFGYRLRSMPGAHSLSVYAGTLVVVYIFAYVVSAMSEMHTYRVRGFLLKMVERLTGPVVSS